MSRDGFAAIEREEQQAQDEQDEKNTARWDQAIKSYKDRTEWRKAQGNPSTQPEQWAERAQFDKQNAEVYRDATRYRWIRQLAEEGCLVERIAGALLPYTPEEFDAAIDAAMRR